MNYSVTEFENAAMFRLADQFDGLATGRNQVPSRRVSSSFRQEHTDPLWCQTHDVIVEKSGALFQHFLASLPCILEEMCRVNAALARLQVVEGIEQNRQGHSFFALDAFDGSQARALTYITKGAFASHTCSPNSGNQAFFELYNECQQATFAQAPFFEAVKDHTKAGPKDAFDVIYETAAFQFYGKDRRKQIDIADQALKDDGIMILLEKSLRGDPQLFELEEDRKDDFHKTKYFSAQEIAWKKHQMLESMHDGLVELDDLLSVASERYENACVLWNGGNFFEIAACRDKSRLEKFTSLLGGICLDQGFDLDPQVGRWVTA
ncbi:MAG: hypothetical protein ABJL99_25585 [Aliishimia sp.]